MLITHELLFDELTKFLESYLIKTNASWLRLNFTRIYEKSFQNNKFLELQKWCNNIVTKYPNKVFDSENFTSLQENALISLIGRDDLQMEEVKIWNYVIKWGVAHDPNLPFDPSNWTKENFLSLNTILKNCLPLIRYFQMSNDDIIEHVQPYHQILGKNLWDDILKKLNTPNQIISTIILPPRVILTQNLPHRVTVPFSTVINEDHAAEIASWVDNKADTYSTSNNPYEFKLLFRGSRDGFTAKSFWNLCDKQTNVVVVIEVKETNEILGGYNPIGWDKPKKSRIYKNCDKSFIFSLKNDTIQNSILSRITDRGQNKAIACCSKFGPSFRNGLYIKDRCDEIDRCYCWYDSKDTYYEKIRDTSLYLHDTSFIYGYKSGFSVNDYEVFQIYKKNL
ncbi:hypothetical protein C2G38_1423265 [Gigaspora rosea]|uniref:TLDc domain-containing protein n=1 Tax=Gigaspora rosea TaxID=44941 RepID=A0A397W8T3_9GLOM|nr:hypothetical protein C2G38_1423265 [Gigaspora rosea]